MRYNVDRNVPDRVLGDEARLRQVLLNLLNNAIKFTEVGSVTVSVQSQRSADGRERVLFSVADTGVGIPAQQQYRLFKKFSQADDSVDRRHGGTGLGLAICKRLVHLMEGEIGVVSEIGQGSTFWFTAFLPATATPSTGRAS
jgi:signal transduction histidine kinase